MLPRTSWVRASKLSLSPGAETRDTPLLEVSFAFCKVLSCLLLRHDTVDKNAVWNLRSRIYLISFKPARKTSCNLPL